MASVDSDESSAGVGKIKLNRSDGHEHDLVSVYTGKSAPDLFHVKQNGEEVNRTRGTLRMEPDHDSIKLHRSDGLNCDIIRVFKSMSDGNGESLQRKPTNDCVIDRSSMTKIEVQNILSGSSGGVNAPIFTRSELSDAPTSARIIHMADTHNHFSKSTSKNFLPEGDILIHSGGFTVNGTEEEYVQFDAWLASVKEMYHYRVVVAGLPDVKQCGNDWDYVKAMLPNATHVLCHSEATLLGMRIYGSPWHWAHEQNYTCKVGAPSSTSGRFDEIPVGIHVLVTHGPSYGRLDYTPGGWSSMSTKGIDQNEYRSAGHNTGQGRSGSSELRDAIEHVRPGLHLHGLCAGSRGVLLPVGHTPLVLNSCMCDISGDLLCSCPHVVRCNLIFSRDAADESVTAREWEFTLDSLA